MDLEYAIVCAVVFIVGIIIGTVLTKIRYSRKIPWAGNVVIDTRRPNGDTIGIESPKNITHWHKYKEIRFTVIAMWGDTNAKKETL